MNVVVDDIVAGKDYSANLMDNYQHILELMVGYGLACESTECGGGAHDTELITVS